MNLPSGPFMLQRILASLTFRPTIHRHIYLFWFCSAILNILSTLFHKSIRKIDMQNIQFRCRTCLISGEVSRGKPVLKKRKSLLSVVFTQILSRIHSYTHSSKITMPSARITAFAYLNKIRQLYVFRLDVGNDPTSLSRKQYFNLFSQSSLKSVRTLRINNFLKVSSRLHDVLWLKIHMTKLTVRNLSKTCYTNDYEQP